MSDLDALRAERDAAWHNLQVHPNYDSWSRRAHGALPTEESIEQAHQDYRDADARYREAAGLPPVTEYRGNPDAPELTDAELLSRAGRLIAARRTFPAKAAKCAKCGKEFEARGRGLYCSPSCRTLASRARKQDATPPRRRPPVAGGRVE